MGGRILVAALAAAFALPAPALAAGPLGLDCAPKGGVRFCEGNGSTQRVATFDGVPLDADVTLPAAGDGPFPTIVMLHGWGGSKTSFESSSPGGGYSNTFFARRGYAVLNYT